MVKEKCNNPTCENELVHTQGRKKKKYCSIKCKNYVTMSKFLSKPKENKTVRININEYNDLLTYKKSFNERLELELNKHKQIIKQPSKPSLTEKQTSVSYENIKDKCELSRLEGESALEYKIRISETIKKQI
jgi:hypothetical protein